MSADSTLVDLDSLLALFFDGLQPLGRFAEVEADQVDVLEHRTDGDHYSRKILLRRQSDAKVVMYGIVRLLLPAVTDVVRQQIESREIPLGRVLINHNVLREVQLLGLYRRRRCLFWADGDHPL